MGEKLTAALYSSDGAAAGDVNLEAEVFGVEPSVATMHQVVTAQLAAARSGSANTKTRAEVRGGGAKPWRQKGLGRARHGSIRSPQWVGGGVAFGPKPRSYAQRTPRKMKRLALRGALSVRAGEGRVHVVEAFDWDEPRTKKAKELLGRIGLTGKVLIVLTEADVVAYRSFRNLPEIIVSVPGQLTTYDVLWAEDVVFTRAALAGLVGGDGYDVTDRDFVPEEPVAAAAGGGDGGEEE